MKGAGIALLSLVGLLLASPRVSACACRGVASPGAALTAPGEVWGLSLSGSAEIAHGSWDHEGTYEELLDNELFAREALGLELGWRVHDHSEIGVSTSLVSARVGTPTFEDENSSFGDTRVGVRWEISDEAMPHASVPWPALSLLAGITVPTGDVALDRAASTGLGAAEVALGLQLVRSLPHAWQLEATSEFALRSPDDELGFERQLGPRAWLELGLSQAVVPSLRLGAFTGVTWEGDATYDGRLSEGSGQRLWTVSLFGVRELESIGGRASMTVEHAPALDGVSANAIGNTALRLALSFSR